MYKGISTLEAYELCLKRGLCHDHLKEFHKEESSVPNITELPRKAFLFIRINILSTILFKKSTKCEKIKILLQKTPIFSRILANGDASEVVDDILVLDSVVIFTLCELSKICCTAALFQVINENTGDPELEPLKKLLLVDRIEGPILHHLYPLLQENFIGFDLDLIKVSYVLTLLFVRNCVKLDIKTALKTIEEDFKGDMHWEDFKNSGDAAFQNKNYKVALQDYSTAITFNSYSSELFAQKADVCLKLRESKAAQLNAYISIIINPESSNGYYCLALSYEDQKLLKEAWMIAKYGSTMCEKDESAYKKLIALIRNYEKALFTNKSLENIIENSVDNRELTESVPELVDSDSDDDDEKIYVKNVPELVDASDSDESENMEKKTVNTHIKNKTKKKRVPPIPTEDSLDGTSIDMRKVRDCLKEASEALLSDSGYKAVQIFRGPLRNFMESPSFNSLEENEIVCIKYAYGIAYCKSGGYDDLLKGITILKEITEKHDSVTFPTANYAIGLAYRKLNRFKDALNHLETVNNFLSKGIHFKVYSWPEIITVIQETKPDILKDLVHELIKECENPPNPDALCRYTLCGYQPTIYYSDPDFKGYTTVFCSEQCCLQYHLQCWKTMKAERNLTDKEFLEQNCFTPDCEGIFIKIQNIDKKGDVAKEFTSDLKKSIKPKSTKWEKKTDIKEKKKKKANIKSEDSTQEISSENGRSSSRKNSTSSDKFNILLISGCTLPSAEGASSLDSMQKSAQKSKSIESNDTESSDNFSVPTIHVQEMQRSGILENKIKSNTKEAKFVANAFEQETLKITQDSEKHIESNSKAENVIKSYDFSKENEIKLQDLNPKYSVNDDNKSSLNNIFLSESIKKNVYSYMRDFLQHHGPLRIDDQLLMDEVLNFPEEANTIIAEFGGIVEFLKSDMRFACVADKYICVIADIAKAYQMNIANSSPTDLDDFPPLDSINNLKYNQSNKDNKHPNFYLNPNAIEYKPSVKKKDIGHKVNVSNSEIISNVNNSMFSLKSSSSEFISDSNNCEKNISNSQETILKMNSCPNFKPVSSIGFDSELTKLNGDVKNTEISGDNKEKTQQIFKAANKSDVNFKLNSLEKGKNLFMSAVDLPSSDKDIQMSSNKMLESSKIKKVQVQLLPVLKEYCNEDYKNYHSYVNSCIKPYCLRKLTETATKETETDFNKMEIPPAEHSKQIADALKAINRKLALDNMSLKDQMKVISNQKDELLGEIYSLKLTLTKTYEDFEAIKLEHSKKEEKLVNGREYLLKCLTDSHTSIDELKKRISVLEAVNSRFEKTVEDLNASLKEVEEKNKRELEAEEKKYNGVTKKFLKENSELKSRVKFAEIKYLQTKKTEYLNRIEDKLIDADLKKQEFTQGLSMISGNLNPMIHTSMKTIYAELSTYVKELNALKLDFTKTIDGQIEKVENGVSLQDLNVVELKKIPDPPHLRSLLPGVDKCLPSSSQMDFNLFKFGTSPQMPSAAIIPSSVTSAVVAPPSVFSKPLLIPTVSSQTKSSAPAIPQMSPSATIIPQSIPLAAIIPQAVPSATVKSHIAPLATVVPLVSPSTTIVPQASPSASSIPQATSSTTIVPSSGPAATVISSLPATDTNLKSSLDLNSHLSEPFKNTMTSVNSFTGMPPTVPTLDPEFNKTCAIFKPPDPVSNYKSKVPPGIVGSKTSSVSSRTTSSSSKDSSEALHTGSSNDLLVSFPSSSSKDSLETFPSAERTLSTLNSSTKDPGSNSSQLEKKAAGSKTGSSYDKLLKKLKEHFPSYTQEELISFVKEFRSQRHGKLTGLPIDTIISELKIFVLGKERQKKLQEQRLAQLQPKTSKVLVNKKLVPDPKACPPIDQQQSVKKKSAWGIDPNNKKTFSGNIDDDCTICCDPMSRTSAYKVGCGHFFHEECIRQWLKNKSNCPVCRVLLLLPEEYPSLS